MKINSVESLTVRTHSHIVRIQTDTGLTGIGEAGFWGFPEGTEGILTRLTKYLIGKDPMRIDHHWQYIYRNNHHRGGALHAALSAIDIALWDIKGKHYDAPVWQLLGGKCRDKVRVYMHIRGATDEELAEDARRKVRDGFTAVRFGPFVPEAQRLTHTGLLKTTVSRVKAVRDAVGDDVDVLIDVHNRLTPSDAIVLGRELEKYRLLFIEDPTKQDTAEAMAYVAANCPVPVATGERLHTLFEFKDFLHSRACAYVRPDVCLAGGITQTKKIVALAEAYQVIAVPHNPLSPISTAACVQVDACSPNCLIQEYTGDGMGGAVLFDEAGDAWKREIVKSPLKLEKGFLIVPDAPGIGIELDDEGVEKNVKAFSERPLRTPLHLDGSVADS
jgi:galactonate dehydratase